MRIGRLAVALLAWVALEGCTADGPLEGGRMSTVTMRFLTPATVKSLVVEVTGPGISPAVVMNIAVGADTVATGSLSLPSGSARRFVVTAVDTAGVHTHRADTTVTLQPGANPNLAMRLDPLPSSLGITVTFGGVRLVVPDASTRILSLGSTATIVAYAIRANGDTVSADSLTWGSSNPAVAAATSGGSVTGVRTGAANIAVSYRGASARIPVTVSTGGSSSAIAIDSAPNAGASGMIALGSLGNPQVFSVSFWFKPVMLADRHHLLLDASHSGGANWVYQYLGDGWCFTTACVTLTSGTWYHILLTYDNGTVKYFVDGKLRSTTAYTISYSSAAPTLYLGNWPVGSRQFAGELDDLYITTDLQQSADFTPPVTIGTPSANLFGLWRFEEGSGSQTLSSSGAALSLGIWTWTTRAF